MTTFERIKNLADNQKISLQKVAIDIGLSENAIYGWKTRKPKGEDLAKVADYFHVSVDYLLGREELKKTNKPVDLKKVISEKKPTSWDDPRIDWNEWVSFDGEPISDDVKKMLFAIYGDKLTD
ncbi:XRE family transcriptional regulator [Lactococcus lactis]|uniref:XRE family transcriptional regulator n=1 Tax=Lactococcus lactis TaxID=1358 RepID=UPI000BA6C937|nr:XRE family transcriptional regulator [Lactococcus lactis]PAK68101.1 XRE family transcriptional regulator [Lactococcus lactis]PEN20112.1 XRE family transcriptional regulator [Lactococcus lactis]